MTISIFGSTGKAGRIILDYMLKHNYRVKALVRNKQKADQVFSKLSNLNYLEILQGNALEHQDVLRTIEGTDVVVSAIGHTYNSPKHLQYYFIQHTVFAMKAFSIKRIIILTGAGIFLKMDKPSLIDKLMLNLIKLIDPYRIEDARKMIEYITTTDLDWTIVRTYLQYGSQNTSLQNNLCKLQIGRLGDRKFKLFCSRHSIAKFIVEECISKNNYIREAPVIFG